MQEWGVKEETATGGGRGKRQCGDGLRGLWGAVTGGTKVQYLGRILTEGDDNWPAVAGNLVQARNSWGRLQGILIREGATKRVLGDFFKAVVQQVLLFGAETWVVSTRMERSLSVFVHGAARRITGR